MTHQRAVWISSSTDSLSLSTGSALAPSLMIAAPATIARKTIWRTSTSVKAVTMLVGKIPVRKSIQLPVDFGALRPSVLRLVPSPGLVSRPRPRPMATAISEVIANQSRVRTASRAALVTFRRLATLTRIAVKTSGGTASFSSWTKIRPMVSRVVASQEMSAARAR